MKHLLIALGLGACLAATASAQNSPGSERPAKKIIVQGRNGKHVEVAAYPSDKEHSVYYITTANTVGSHIPAVFCRYQGHNTAMHQSSPGSGYGTADIGTTGALNVQGALYTLDPAFAGFRRGR